MTDPVVWTGDAESGSATAATRRLSTLLVDGHEDVVPFAVVSDAGRLVVATPPADAGDVLPAILGAPRFAPVLAAVDRIDRWCAEHDSRALLAPDVLALDNTALFGPVLGEAVTVCAAHRIPDVAGFVRDRTERCLEWLALFLDRFARDRRRLAADVVESLSTHGFESHNRGRRVLRVGFGGRAVAYKDRPARAEAALADLGDASVFGFVNGLAPEHGDVDLPQYAVLLGEDADCLWQAWIDSPTPEPLTAASPVTGTVLDDDEASWFHKRSGALAAACLAFGIGDLGVGNIVIGDDGDERRYVPIDLEIVRRPLTRLAGTGLVPSGDDDTHHVGFENRARRCGHEGSPAYWDVSGPTWTMRFVERPWERRHAAIVADGDGRVGFGRHLDDVVSGAFGMWSLLCRHREAVAEVAARALADVPIRVLPRSTAEYSDALSRRLLLGEPLDPSFTVSEREQLESGDVPYYAADPDGATVRHLASDGRWVPSDVDVPGQLAPGPIDDGWDLTSLGPALFDLVDFAATDGTGLRAPDEISVDWHRGGHRLTYLRRGDVIRLVPDPLPDVADEYADVAARLLRVDAIDATLRAEWVDADFADGETADRLAALTTEALRWLESVVDVHGWTSADLVGEEAADAAVRLVQHTEGVPARRRRLFTALRRAYDRGEAPGRHVAYTEDALLVDADRPQRYGTKFVKRDDDFVPHPIEDPDGVDDRRRRMGLPPLAEYADVIRRRFRQEDPT